MMSETKQSSTTVTVTTTKTGPTLPDGIKLRFDYLKTIPCILKFIELLLSLIAMACTSPAYFGANKFFVAVLSICFIFTLVFILIHFTNVPNVLLNVPWLLFELFYCVIGGGVTLLAAAIHLGVSGKYDIALSYARILDSYYAAGAIAIICSILYGVEAYLLFKQRQELQTTTPAQ